jgi:uncharacterized protein
VRRLIYLLILTVLLTGADSGRALFDQPGAALAQQAQQQRRPNIFEMIFGGGLRRQIFNNRRRQPEPTNTRRVIVSEPNRVREPKTPPKPVVEKAENAAKILIVGDFLANGMAWGLEQAYAENPNVVFIDKSSGLSGLVRDDVVDWPGVIGPYIDETNPIAVIVLVGMNDRQQMRLPDGAVDKLTDGWKREYQSRIRAVIENVKSRNIALIWVGLPAVKSNNMNSDYTVFNEFYRTNVEAAEGQFVDIWDGFTNAEGAFISAGPDINGQIVRLRNSDGINMTNAGKQKLAFYAERAIRKATGLGSDAIAEALPDLGGAEALRSPLYDPAETGKTIVISLDDPQMDGSDILDGEADPKGQDEEKYSTAYRLVHEGVAAAPHAGRIDADWGPPEPAREKNPSPIAAPPATATPDPVTE